MTTQLGLQTSLTGIDYLEDLHAQEGCNFWCRGDKHAMECVTNHDLDLQNPADVAKIKKQVELDVPGLTAHDVLLSESEPEPWDGAVDLAGRFNPQQNLTQPFVLIYSVDRS